MNRQLVAECIAANIERLRRERGLSLGELSVRAELHRTHLGVLVRGKRLARVDTIIKLAAALELPPGALLTGVAWEPPSGRRPAGSFKAVGGVRAEPAPRA